MASRGPRKSLPNTKYCYMLTCSHDNILTPQKKFFCVPNTNRLEWCQGAGLDYAPKGPLYICEDHLNLEEDIENYYYWKIMNGNAKLKPRLPACFQKQQTDAEQQQQTDEAESSTSNDKSGPSSVSVGIMCCPATANQQAQVKVAVKNKATYCSINIKAKKRKLDETAFLSDERSPTGSLDGSSYEVLEKDSSSSNTPCTPTRKNEKDLVGRNFMLNVIKKKPMQYLGLPKEYYWMIEYLARTCDTVTSLGIITTLYKIKSNDTFNKISDLFEISLTTLWRNYFSTLTVLSKFFNQYVYWPPALVIKQKLPDAFKVHKDYAQIQAIIDCFEVQIEQPSNPVEQALTWSQYKGCNTAKFLISATPAGFINFISIGYGGRMSDIALVEQCGFIDVIPPNCTILADRGFKNLEPILSHKGIKLVRPPSVYSNITPTKEEVLKTKVIASLRVHIERVIRRVRMYSILKPHSTVNNKLTNTLNKVVQVACGLINLQTPIIRNT